ncbi:MAG: hypothetical protein C5B51_29990 [Terriglobia bacterium]|nr:MAG: hypothetical protein C5B51_29990 [Terriglobia bacterium]
MEVGPRTRLHTLAVDVYLAVYLAAGAAILGGAILQWNCPDYLRFLSYLASAVVASALKVRFPGVPGTVSVGFLFVFIGLVDLSPHEAIVLGTVPAIVQCLWHTQKRPRLIQVSFSIAVIATAVFVSGEVFATARRLAPEPVALGLLAISYFVVNTYSIAGIIALTEPVSLASTLKSEAWILPYYCGGVSAAWLIGTMPTAIHWELPIISLPLVYLVHRSYGMHTAQLEREKEHVEEISEVHLQTIEALALAIDAKDHATHDHLQRVQFYAVELGKELGLNALQLDALRAASVLHDIGKLAVPEQILCKPGKLTPAEFEKIKIHPVVGAEILGRVRFPYPVVPIVRAHHEKWDGSGYPEGLKGEEIPVGARILAAADCLDALASDRQYRPALPLDEAMAKIAAESGTSFDPAVVRVMQQRYREWEHGAQQQPARERPGVSTEIRITRGAAPAAGYSAESQRPPANPVPARVPAHSLAVRDVSELAGRLQSAVPCDAIAFFENEGAVLCSQFASGPDASALQELRVPWGEGLVGWVAQRNTPIVNGNPRVEPGYGAKPDAADDLQSALAVPLAGDNGMRGVWALYRRHPDAFSSADLFALALQLHEPGRVAAPDPYCQAGSAYRSA